MEIGLTSYDDYAIEPAHRHSLVIEYMYMLSGKTKYIDLDNNEIYEYEAGDFFTIYPGTTYAQKSEKGTKILFVKEESINDKELVEMNEEVKNWLDDGIV